jgi:hypothetical protein
MIELTLKVKAGYGRKNMGDHTNPEPYRAPTKRGAVVVLQTMSFKLHARVEQVGSLSYVGRIMDCPMAEYLGEEIVFSERHIHTRDRPATS